LGRLCSRASIAPGLASEAATKLMPTGSNVAGGNLSLLDEWRAIRREDRLRTGISAKWRQQVRVDHPMPAIPKICSFLQQFADLVGSQLAVAENSVEQTGADGLARVHRHNGARPSS